MDFSGLIKVKENKPARRRDWSENKTMIQFINVTKEFHNGTVGLKNIDVKIEEGEFVFFVGASGAGKSTFT